MKTNTHGRLRSIALFLIGLLVGGGALYGLGWAGLLPGMGHTDHPQHGAAAPAGASVGVPKYHCPMHPTYTSDRPSDCPICGMKLVAIDTKLVADAGGAGEAAAATAIAPTPGEPWTCPVHPTYTHAEPGACIIDGETLLDARDPVQSARIQWSPPQPDGLTTVQIAPERQQLIGLTTATVVSGPVGRVWRTSGRVAVDETRVRKVNVKVQGFVDALHVDFVGREVKKGEALLEIYSPDLVSAQTELLLAARTDQALASAALGDGPGGAGPTGLVEAAQQKLKLWDVPKSLIAKVERTGRVQKTLTLVSPIAGVVTQKNVVQGSPLNPGDAPFEITDLSRVWVVADVYANEIGQVHKGMAASLTLQGVPGAFTGEVAFVDPLMDEQKRTVRVRLSFANTDGQLRPGLFGEVTFRTEARDGLRIPSDAVLDSGTQQVVFLVQDKGHFKPVVVRTGPAPDGQVEVTAGLQVGDRVVTRAAFLVDSESSLKAALGALMPDHGGAK
jgi:Cu(I)/Ag(I) efflux system membrane fusion protein